MRVLRRDCLLGGRGLFGGGHVATAAASRDEEAEVALEQRAGVDAAAMGPGPNDILRSALFSEALRAPRPPSQPSACDSHRAPHLSKASEAVLERGCRAQPRDEGSAAPRPLNDILQPGDAFPKPSACAADENMRALCELLKEAAIGREAPRRPPPGSSPSLHGTTREPAPLCTVGLL